MEDTIKKLGTLRKQDEGRDAVHIAVLTMQAKKRIYPYGKTWVDKTGLEVKANSEFAIGLVDPFLPDGTAIEVGDWFYVYLKPASITGLQHVWKHPEFEDVVSGTSAPATEVISAEERVRRFCDNSDVNYDQFLEVLKTGTTSEYDEDYGAYRLTWWGDEYITSIGRDAYGEIPNEIIDDVELILGIKLDRRPKYFSCSC